MRISEIASLRRSATRTLMDWIQHDHRYLALGLELIVGVGRPKFERLFPKSEAFLARRYPGPRVDLLGRDLYFNVGVRLLRPPWSAYDGTHIRFQQSKTGRRIVMPAGTPLKALLDLSERRGPVILTNTMGRRWTADGFGSSWGKLSDRAGIATLRFTISEGRPSCGSLSPARQCQRSRHSPDIALRTSRPLKREQNCKMSCKTVRVRCGGYAAKPLKSLVGAPGLEPGTR